MSTDHSGAAPLAIAVLGAESTGKTSLSLALAELLPGRLGRPAIVLPEVLRGWCETAGRTPRRDEQAAIAEAQGRQLDDALARAPASSIIIADTTPLMTAIYSELLFADATLHPAALAHQRRYALTLVCGLDLPWQADGIQRDGPHVRVPVDNAIRAALQSAGLPYQVIYGSGAERCETALRAIEEFALKAIAESAGGISATGTFGTEYSGSDTQGAGSADALVWRCERCGDAACERRLFTALLDGAAQAPPTTAAATATPSATGASTAPNRCPAPARPPR